MQKPCSPFTLQRLFCHTEHNLFAVGPLDERPWPSVNQLLPRSSTRRHFVPLNHIVALPVDDADDPKPDRYDSTEKNLERVRARVHQVQLADHEERSPAWQIEITNGMINMDVIHYCAEGTCAKAGRRQAAGVVETVQAVS